MAEGDCVSCPLLGEDGCLPTLKRKSPSAPSTPSITSCPPRTSTTVSRIAWPAWAAWVTPATLPSPTGRADDRPRSQSPGLLRLLLGEGPRRPVRDSLPDHHQPRRPLSRPLRPAPRTLDRPPPQPPLLPHRTRHPESARQGTPLASCHGMGNRQRPSRHKNRPQTHPPPHAKQKARWLHRATEKMLNQVRDDWKTWKKDGYA